MFAPECLAIPYEPVEVFDSPSGLRIGHLVLDHPEYARKSVADCVFRPTARLRPEGTHNQLPVYLQHLGPQEPSLAVFKVEDVNGQLWVQGRTQLGQFWLSVNGGRQFLSLERDLKQGLAALTETCDEVGRCLPTSVSTQRLAEAAGLERQDSCFANAYDIEAITRLPDGRLAYEVHLAPQLSAKYADKLPATARVPTRDYRGRWTGFFDPAGCAEPRP